MDDIRLLAGDLLGQVDEVAWAEGVFGHKLDDWQRTVMTSERKKLILNISRQLGKSSMAALLSLRKAEVEPGSLILLLSPTLRQSGELLYTVNSINQGREVVAESATRLEFENGSRIISLPGAERTVRGYAGVDLIIIDEASRVEDELYYTVRPMLAVSGGRIVVMSTPFGKRGWFWETWDRGIGWSRHKITAWECPRITHEFLEEEREVLGDLWFAQEYECEFIDAQGSIFSPDAIEKVLGEQVEVWDL